MEHNIEHHLNSDIPLASLSGRGISPSAGSYALPSPAIVFSAFARTSLIDAELVMLNVLCLTAVNIEGDFLR